MKSFIFVFVALMGHTFAGEIRHQDLWPREATDAWQKAGTRADFLAALLSRYKVLDESPSAESPAVVETAGVQFPEELPERYFIRAFREMGDQEREEIAIRMSIRDRRIPGSSAADLNVRIIGNWLASRGPLLVFFESQRAKLKDILEIRIQVTDPQLLAELEARAASGGLVDGETALLEKLRWATDKIKCISRFIEEGEARESGKGWWPNGNRGGYEKRMSSWVSSSGLGRRFVFQKLSSAARGILERNGFKLKRDSMLNPSCAMLAAQLAPTTSALTIE